MSLFNCPEAFLLRQFHLLSSQMFQKIETWKIQGESSQLVSQIRILSMDETIGISKFICHIFNKFPE